uniref:CUB domain-containing protein n=1 Tax=Neogobius melanostomus TaxID=47308 RepID=A0A8C6U660_9GOBI
MQRRQSVCPAGCGGVIHADSGIIKSPNYPQNFPANSECLWHIIAHQGNHLEFNRFDLEASSSCRYDYVAVYDGPNTLAPLLGTFCGSELPPHLKSSTSHLYLVFRTDYAVSGEGWRASYSETLVRLIGCGGYLSMPMGMLGSPDPNLDGRYEPRMDCTWIIEMPVNKAVNLSFSSFDLESSSDCRYDYVKVRLYDGDSTHWPLVGTFCGSSVPSFFVSSGNFLTVVFKTDSSVQRAGFNATYMSVPRESILPCIRLGAITFFFYTDTSTILFLIPILEYLSSRTRKQNNNVWKIYQFTISGSSPTNICIKLLIYFHYNTDVFIVEINDQTSMCVCCEQRPLPR